MDLLRRVFRIQLFPCPRCGGQSWVESYVLHPTPEVLAAAGLPAVSSVPAGPRAGPRVPVETVVLLD